MLAYLTKTYYENMRQMYLVGFTRQAFFLIKIRIYNYTNKKLIILMLGIRTFIFFRDESWLQPVWKCY
jgi:hypothetical protein